MTSILDEYLARVRAALAELPEHERDAIVDEMGAHLEDAIAQRLQADPTLTPEAAALAETRAFGEPEEIAAARGALAGPAPRRQQAPRAWRRRLPWAAAGAALVLVAAVAAVGLLGEAPQGTTLYDRRNVFQSPHTGIVNETFTVSPSTRALAILVQVEEANATGCAGVRITDPRGAVVLDAWSSCGSMRHALAFHPDENGQTGAWRVEIQYTDFVGGLAITTDAKTMR